MLPPSSWCHNSEGHHIITVRPQNYDMGYQTK